VDCLSQVCKTRIDELSQALDTLAKRGPLRRLRPKAPLNEAVFARGEHRLPFTGSHAVQYLQFAAGAERDDNAVSRQVQLFEFGR
jgi:hypothetical protein